MLNNKPEQKTLPDPKQYPVLPPDMNYIYFENIGTFPFEPDNREYSPVNAWHLAEASFLAYNHPGFSRMAYKLAGYSGFRFFGGKTTECFVSWNESCIIISFRGTEIKSVTAVSEVLTDLNASMVDYPGGGRVHQGFLAAIGEIWSGEDGLEDFINQLCNEIPERALWITGHSLGAALAAIVFERIKGATGLYLYGSPRIGNSIFADLFTNRTVYRVENMGDPIVRVPPETGNGKNSFRHIGVPVYIRDNGEIEFRREKFDLKKQKGEAEITIKKQLKNTAVLSLSSLKQLKKNTSAKNLFSTGRDVSRDLVSEWGTHFSTAVGEWNDYFVNIDKMIKMNLDCHAPIYYAVKLWNALVGTVLQEKK